MIDDTNHAQALEIYGWLSSEDIFYINEITYIELLTVLTYKKWIQSIADIKGIITDMGVIFIASGNMEYIRYHEYLAKKISVVDVSILYDAKKNGSQVLSFDKDLLKLV
jgi:predicted nucleic-acid-binding protein